MKLNILGKGVISGSSSQNLKPDDFLKEPLIPNYSDLFTEPLQRYGRFDNYTKIGCSAVALALKDAGLYSTDKKRSFGLIISSVYESYKTDIEYYKTTIENSGTFTSPNLFSYTLPGIVLGECAAYFKLTGPTFCVGENGEFGESALKAACLMLDSGETETVIAGWLDYPPDNIKAYRGAVFVVLTVNMSINRGITVSLEKLTSLLDIFKII
jgi:3-oxoacyl-(acyl-carrier-protein) synthase